jgi:hypothetical protein
MINWRRHLGLAAAFAMVGTLLCAAAPAAEPAGTPAPIPIGSAVVVFAPEAPYTRLPRFDLDQYGGWTGLSGKTTGYFHAEQIGNRWWLVTPEGHAFFILSMTGVPDAALRTYKSWGFNAVDQAATPPAADRHMPYTIGASFLDLAEKLPLPPNPAIPPWVNFCDVFDPTWVRKCDEYAQTTLAPFAKDPWLIGYFTDNEPNFTGWYEVVTHLPRNAPFRKAFVEVARTYYADKPGQLAKDWKALNVANVDDLLRVEGDAPALPELAAAWQEAVAEQAFATIEKAARKALPNHLNLGPRLINSVPPSAQVFAALGRHVDVISLNFYSLFSDRLLSQMFTLLPAIHGFTKKPLLVSEFTFRGADTGCPNTVGAPPTVPTQADRAVGYLSYLSAVSSLPFFVGASWYKYSDDCQELPWDKYGEDSNVGVVDGYGRPYAALVQTMRLVNGNVYELAADPVANPKCPLFYRTELMRWDREWDKQMLMRLGQMDRPLPDPLGDQLPEPRRYHEHYWVSHKSPKLIVNDERFLGWCEANMLRTHDDGQELALIGLEGLVTMPRGSWLGPQCSDPDKPFPVDSNAQLLVRRLDNKGRLRRLTMIGGSFVRTEFQDLLIRASSKVPYLNLQYDPDAKMLAITSQGVIQNVGVHGVAGWKATWNGKPVVAKAVPGGKGIAAFTPPTQ